MKRAAALLLALAAPAAAQAPGPPPAAVPSLAWLHGEWEGTATMFGRPATVSISASPVLLGRATSLAYRVHIPADARQGEFRFEGRGTYRLAADGKVAGQWSDSQGNFHPLAGRVTGTVMHVTWGEPRSEIGQSSYVLGADGALVVSDAALGKEGLKVFATGRYTRKQ